jgi:hypothetical protein
MNSQKLTHVFRIVSLFVLFGTGFFSGVTPVFAVGEPVITARFAESILPTAAIPTAEITDEGLSPVIGVWVEYGTTDSYGTEQQRFNLNELTIPGVINAELTGLTCDTTYHYRFRARNNNLLDGYSPDATFTTSPCYFSNTVAHWTLNELSGTRVDNVGDNHLTPINNPTTVTGYINDGLQSSISGSEYVTIDDNAELSTGGETSFTISLWVKLLSKTGTQVFVSKYGTDSEYAVYFENTFDRFVFSTYSSEGNHFIKADQLGSPEVGTWYHIIATHDADTNTNSILINDGVADTLADVPEHTDSTAAFLIGAFGSAPTFFADAVIDDVRFAKSVYDLPDPLPLFAGGDGTELDPYQISTCQQLQNMNQHLDAYYILINNFDCTASETWNENVDEWVDGIVDGELIPDSYSTDTGSDVVVTNNGYFGFEPIGDEETPFTGRLDGDDYTISNLWIFRKNTDRVGLFGSIQDAHLLELNLVDSDIVGSDNTGGLVGFVGANSEITDIDLQNNMVRAYLAYNGGGLAGRIEGATNVSNITNTGGTVHGSGSVIGGIVGYLESTTIDNASSSAAVDGGYQVGGFVGNMNQSTITNSSATGNVQSDRLESELFVKSGYYAGGFVGDMYQSTIEDSYATGDISTTGDYAGGFAGSVSESTITNSYAVGSVTGVNETISENNYIPNYLGGFAGRTSSESQIQGSYATGNVTTDGDDVGGFVGNTSCGVVIGHSYATGNVTGDDDVGGFVGFSGCEGPSTDFTQVFSMGDVTGDEYVGGFAGYLSSASITNAYTSASIVTGNEYVGGFAGSMNYTDTDNVYSRADVSAAGEYVGGFAGYNFNDGEPIEGLWDTTIETGLTGCGNAEGLDCDGVTGKTTSEMNTQATFDAVHYNFDDVWAIDETNDGYPYFPDMDIVEGPTEIFVITNTATSITQTSVALNATVTEGSFNAYGFFIGTESYDDNEVPEYDQFSEIGDVFGAMLALYSSTDGTGSFDIVEPPFDYSTPFESLECDTTYYFRPIVYLGMDTNLGMGIGDEGSFTTVACDDGEPEPTPDRPKRRSVSSAIRAQFYSTTPANSSSTAQATPVEAQCPAGQILTQNLRAPSRNGVFNSYTKGIVREAKILQAHLNRLGFNSGPEDGILGPISTGAIKRMQTYLKTYADGYVGPITRGLLNKSCGAEGLKNS